MRKSLLVLILLCVYPVSSWSALNGWVYSQNHTVASTSDGILTDYQKQLLVIRGTVNNWSTGTLFLTGQFIKPSVPNGYVYEATTSFTAGAVEPTWGTTEGGVVADNATANAWKCRGDVLFAGSKIKADFADFRITKSDGNTKIPYFIESQYPYPTITRLSKNINASYISPLNPLVVYAATANDLYKSVDGGVTWGSSLIHFTSGIRIYGVFVASNGRVFVSSPTTSTATAELGLWSSTDDVNWTRVITMTRTTGDVTVWSMAEDLSGGTYNGVIYAGGYGADSGTDPKTLYKSVDGGATFTIAHTFTAAGEAVRHIHATRVDQTNGNIYLIAGDSGFSTDFALYKSINGGSTFAKVSGINQQFTTVEITPTARIMATDAGTGQIWRTFDDVNFELVYDMGVNNNAFWSRRDPDTGYVYIGWTSMSPQLTAYLLVSTDDGATWNKIHDYKCTGSEDGSLWASNIRNNTFFAGYLNNNIHQPGIKYVMNGTQANVVYKIDTLPATGGYNTVIQYGNNNAISESDGNTVFPFFDDFVGSSLDTTTKWNLVTDDSLITTTVANSKASVQISNYAGGAPDWFTEGIRSQTTFSSPIKLKWKTTRIQNYGASSGAGTVFIGMGTNPAATYGYWKDSIAFNLDKVSGLHKSRINTLNNGVSTNLTIVPFSYNMSFDVTATSGKTINAAGQSVTQTVGVPAAGVWPLPIVFGVKRGNTAFTKVSLDLDWVAAQKVTTTEPLNGVWGSEIVQATTTVSSKRNSSWFGFGFKF